jgi:glycosyltransferase involved in cell wall biosynthesis
LTYIRYSIQGLAYKKMHDIEIILPVYNEEAILEENALKVAGFLKKSGYTYKIIIADNGSIDNTFGIAEKLKSKNLNIAVLKFKKKGRGRVLKSMIKDSKCPVIGYMDIDLSTDISHFPGMYNEIGNGYDIIMGSRLLPSSVVQRSLVREALSRAYSCLVRNTLKLPCFDYQCGFKLFKRERILPLIYLIKNDNWFFDTELIYHAFRKGLKVKEVAVRWRERKWGRVKLIPAIIESIAGILRLKYDSAL